jgi:hypothetical protein
MYRVRFTANVRPLEDFRAFAASMPQVAYDTVAAAKKQVEGQFLDELGFTPGPVASPWDGWSVDAAAHERARRWWFAAVDRGEVATDGRHYKRSGKMERGWFLEVSRDGADTRLDVGNREPGAIHVYGSLNMRSQGEAERWQIPGHRKTRWPVMRETVIFWMDVFRERLVETFHDLAEVRIKRRSSR